MTSMKAAADSDIMQVKIHSPFVVYFDGPAVSVSASNDMGQFDILAQHHMLLTLLGSTDVAVGLANGTTKNFPVDRGVMYVKEDRVTVFLDM